MKSKNNLAFSEWKQWHTVVWMYDVFSLDFWLAKYHKVLDFNINKFSYRFVFIFGFPPRASYNRLKNILKSPPSIMFLQCKSVISSKRLQRIDRVFRCSDSLLVLYRLISKKSLSVSHLRCEFCLIHLIFYLRIHNSYYLWNQ